MTFHESEDMRTSFTVTKISQNAICEYLGRLWLHPPVCIYSSTYICDITYLLQCLKQAIWPMEMTKVHNWGEFLHII